MINIQAMMKDIETVLLQDKYRDAVNEELLQDIKEAILNNVKTITGIKRDVKMKIHIINSCIWCEKKIPFQLNKQLCSMKCLKETIKACEDQNGKGTCGYDKSDVIKKVRK